jgi:hypothetical protein
VALREVEGSPSCQWQGQLAGSLDRLAVRSELLEGNLLDDPAARSLYVYRPLIAPMANAALGCEG